MSAPRSSLDNIYSKVERTEEHIAEFYGVSQAFLQKEVYSTVPYTNPKSGQLCEKVVSIHSPPRELRLIMGDAIHNLRAALDFLACGLVNLESPNNNCNYVEFPIGNDSNKFEGKFKKGKPILLAGAKAVDKLKRLGAFPKGKGRDFWVLHRLDIQDKHRLLIVASAAHTGTGAKWQSQSRDVEGFVSLYGSSIIPDKPTILETNTILPLPAIPPEAEQTEYFQHPPLIVINEPRIAEVEPVMDLLERLRTLVEETIVNFEGFFT